MTNLYLPVKIAPITPELLERFKASGEVIQLYPDLKRVTWKNGEWIHHTMFPQQDFLGNTWVSVYKGEPTHYLPDGLPDPSAAVEVFEGTAWSDFDLNSGNCIEMDERAFEEGAKVGVFAIPSGKVEVSK